MVSAAQTVAVGEVVLVVVKPSRARGCSLELELRKFRAALVSLQPEALKLQCGVKSHIAAQN